jgi:putative ABC transport system ATP-binding protein
MGEFVSIMGPSGSGKSTLLHLIGCLDRPTRGTVLFEGKDVRKMGEDQLNKLRLRKIGFVFQTFNLLPTLTAVENVMFPMELTGTSANERRERAEYLLSLMGLSERLHHRPSQLSVGERQRVSIARALANDPLLILADEPTGNLDSKSTEEVVSLLKRVNKELGKTVLVVTHDAQVARKARRLLRLRDGRIVGETVKRR